MTAPVRPGTVDWTGDNPFIYLKTDPEAEWSSLSLFFRVVASRQGRGHALLVLEHPYEPDRAGRRFCLTDNQTLAHDLIARFVSRFGLFRPAHEALRRVEIVPGAQFNTVQDYPNLVTEAGLAPGGRSASLTWRHLGEPFAADVPRDQTQTGEHVMLSVFQPAGSAGVAVDGEDLPGAPVERDFFGGRSMSAAMAHSETWIAVPPGP